MKTEIIELDAEPYLYEFYKKIGADTGRAAEQVMGDVLTKFVNGAPIKK